MATRRLDLILAPAGAGCRVLLDGEELTNCEAVVIEARVGDLTRATLTIHNVEVHVSGEVGEVTTPIRTVKPGADGTSLADIARRVAR